MQSTWNSHRTPQTTYKDFPDCLGRINCRQDSHASGTLGALQDIDRDNAVQKLSPRIIPRAGWSMLPGRTSHSREEIKLSPPMLRDSRDARVNRATLPIVQPMVRRMAATQRRE